MDENESVDIKRFRDLLHMSLGNKNSGSTDPLIQKIIQKHKTKSDHQDMYSLKLEDIEEEIKTRLSSNCYDDIINLAILYSGVAVRTNQLKILDNAIKRVFTEINGSKWITSALERMLSGINDINTTQPKRKLLKLINTLHKVFPNKKLLLNAKYVLVNSSDAPELVEKLKRISNEIYKPVNSFSRLKYEVMKKPSILRNEDTRVLLSQIELMDTPRIFSLANNSIVGRVLSNQSINNSGLLKSSKYYAMYNPMSYNNVKNIFTHQWTNNSPLTMPSYNDLVYKQNTLLQNNKIEGHLISGYTAWRVYRTTPQAASHIAILNAYALFNRNAMNLGDDNIFVILNNVY